MHILYALIFLFVYSAEICCKVEKSYWASIESKLGINAQENARQEFIEKTIRNKQFETIYDLIKDKKYKEQRSCFLRGNCQLHPMDEFAQELQKHGMTPRSFIKEVFKEKKKRIYKQIGISAQAEKEITKQLSFMQTIVKRDGKIDLKSKFKIPKSILSMIEEIRLKENLRTDLLVSTDNADRALAGPGAIAAIGFENIENGSLRAKLILSRSFFLKKDSEQEAILLHEIAGHEKLKHSLVGSLITIITKLKIENSELSRLHEHEANQFPASKDLIRAFTMERYFKKQAALEPRFKQPFSHPNNIDTYRAIKGIRQLHESFERIENNKNRARYDKDKFEKYIVGYEIAWDRWCEREEHSKRFRLLSYVSPWH